MTYLLSNQQDRAMRITAIRHSLKLSRGEFAKTFGIAKGTLQHWENPEDKSGLTEKGASRLLQALKAYGIKTTEDWLLSGLGEMPQLPNSLVVTDRKETSLPMSLKEQENIKKELEIFHEHYKHAVSLMMTDDKMQPLYEKDDVVAGVKLFSEKIQTALGKVCIVMTSKGELLVRRITKSNVPLHYELTTLKPKDENQLAQLEFVAPVVYVRKQVC